MTFAGEPHDHHRYDHAHESPRGDDRRRSCCWPCSRFASAGLPTLPGVFTNFGVQNLLEQARPIGTLATTHGVLMPDLVVPEEHASHAMAVCKLPAGLIGDHDGGARHPARHDRLLVEGASAPTRFARRCGRCTACRGTNGGSTSFTISSSSGRRCSSAAFIAKVLDRGLIDGFIHSLCRDRQGARDLCVGRRRPLDHRQHASTRSPKRPGTWASSLRTLQTGRLRQYVMFIVIGTVVLFLIASVWRYALAG